MNIDRGRLGWGVFFVTLGLVPLAVRFGWIDPAWFEGIWRLWPLILIGIGVGLILRRTAFAAIGNVIVGLTFGLMVGGALATPINAGISCLPGSGGASATPITQTGTFSGEQAEVDISFPCADASLTSQTGNGWAVSATDLDPDDLDVESESDRLSVERSGGSGVWGQGQQARLEVGLPTQQQLDLSIDASAGSISADLAGGHVQDLSLSVNAGEANALLAEASLDGFSISVNAGSAVLSLPATDWQGSASVNAGSLEVCVPEGAAVRVTSSAALGSVDFGEGFTETADGWQTSAWTSSGGGAEMSLSVNLGSAQIRVGGCQ